MTTITTKNLKTSALTHGEMDANFDRDIHQETANYTVDIDDNRAIVECATNAFTVTLPAASAILTGAKAADFRVTIKNIQTATNNITVAPNGTDNIDGANSNYTLYPLHSVTLALDNAGTAWNIIETHLAEAHDKTFTFKSEVIFEGDANFGTKGTDTIGGGTITIDWSAGNKRYMNLTETLAAGDITFTAPGGAANLILHIENAGAFGIDTSPTAWPAAVKWPNGTVPTITSSGDDIIAFYYDGATYWASTLPNYS